MVFKFLGMILYICLIVFLQDTTAIILKNDDITLHLIPTSSGIGLLAFQGETKKLEGILEQETSFSNIECLGHENCIIDDIDFSVTKIENGFQLSWTTSNLEKIFTDCFELHQDMQWYGGPTKKSLNWPVQTAKISGVFPYNLLLGRAFSYAERYWLNSLGAYIFVNDNIPLYVDQNVMKTNQICFIADVSKKDGPYFNRTRNILQYSIVLKDNPKQGHLHAVNNFLGKPTGHPDQRMIKEPIWTTWAKYKTAINDSILLEFAREIRENGYRKGQIEVDDKWEGCYGQQEFSTEKFSNIKNIIKELKQMNFRVTLWIHPFVDHNCQNNSRVGIENDYFVKDRYGRIRGWWWNSNNTYLIDFTNHKARQWWIERVKTLQDDPGIDSFKFDAGETDYCPQPAVYKNVDQELIPNILTGSYLKTCATFGTLIEVRTGWRTQHLPIFTRMLDKDSNWNAANGLYSLITTLLQMNMVGYTMVLPDMIGGNGYSNGYFNEMPDAELLVRWTQANTFMPAMQFSYLPWEYKNTKFDVPAIIKKCVDLHEKYSNKIIEAMNKCVESGSPVNPPIWWVDPTDEEALKCDNEFLLGEDILVAPVIEKGATSRKVYLPKGRWIDGNNGSYYEGPIHLDYHVDITVLPYFILDKSNTKV